MLLPRVGCLDTGLFREYWSRTPKAPTFMRGDPLQVQYKGEGVHFHITESISLGISFELLQGVVPGRMVLPPFPSRCGDL